MIGKVHFYRDLPKIQVKVKVIQTFPDLESFSQRIEFQVGLIHYGWRTFTYKVSHLKFSVTIETAGVEYHWNNTVATEQECS